MLANLCQLAEWVCALRLCSWSCLRGSRLKISELWMFTDFSATMGGNLTNTASSEPQGRQTCCRGLAWGIPLPVWSVFPPVRRRPSVGVK